MELDETPTPIDPEVRAYVSSLVTAVSGHSLCQQLYV